MMFFNKKKHIKEPEIDSKPTIVKHESIEIASNISFCCNVWDDKYKRFFYCHSGTLTFTVSSTSDCESDTMFDMIKTHIIQDVIYAFNNKMLIDCNDPWCANYTKGLFNRVDGVLSKYVPFKQVFNTSEVEYLDLYPICCFTKEHPLFYIMDTGELLDIEKSFYAKFLITSYSPSIQNIIKNLFETIAVDIKTIGEHVSLDQVRFVYGDKSCIIGHI
jgi:hypothetical protein